MSYELIDMGRLQDFIRSIESLSRLAENRSYRFNPMNDRDDDPFWLFEEETNDEIQGAVLQVQRGRVYAISRDVFDLVSVALAQLA